MTHAITFDIDWAPDWCIEQVSQMLIEKEIKATWFITHDSPAIRKLSKYGDLFELGIHPNFQPDSTQGRNPQEVMKNLMRFLPQAVSVRTHGLIQSSHLLKMMREQFGIQFDVSILLYKTPNIVPHTIYTSKNSPIIRIPFFWEDDTEMSVPNPLFSFSEKKYHLPGLKIFNFHIIHLILNSFSLEGYQNCKKLTPQINNLTENMVNPFINHKTGTYTLFNEMIEYMIKKQSNGFTITEIGEKWMKDNCKYDSSK